VAERVVPCNPFKFVTNTAPRIPSATPRSSTDGGLVVGYVADSTTGNALSGAMIRFVRYRGNVAIDTTIVADVDSAGGFAIQLPARGRYRYRVGSVNFGWRRDSIDLQARPETLRVSLPRGLPICDVRVTSNERRPLAIGDL
jgi:hypothetical protein